MGVGARGSGTAWVLRDDAGLIVEGPPLDFAILGQEVNGKAVCFKWFEIRSFPTYPPLVVACSYDDFRDSENPL